MATYCLVSEKDDGAAQARCQSSLAREKIGKGTGERGERAHADDATCGTLGTKVNPQVHGRVYADK